VIAAVSVGTLGWFGIAFAAAPFIATIAGLAGARGLIESGPPAAMSELSTAIGWLLLGSVFCQALGYSAYIGASLIATPAQDAELGGFVAGLFVARVPLLLFQAVQAALLPKLARMLGRGQVVEFRAGLLRLCSAVIVLSIIGVLVALTIGPWLGRLLFGEKFDLDAGGLAMLTAGCCMIVLALMLAQALIALQRYAVTGLAWVFGLAVFIVVFLLPDGDAFFRSEVAVLAGAAAAGAWMGVTAVRSLRPANEPQAVPLA
jgi:O-antigen/teichoic acid export membrane protein